MNAMLLILKVLVIAAIAGGFCFLWVLPFREKKPIGPQQTAPARLIGREIRRGADRSGRSRLGFNHVLRFRLSDGAELELYAHEEEYGSLREGMEGNLTWQGRYFTEMEVL